MGKYGIGARVRDEDGDEGVIVGKRKGERHILYGDDLLGIDMWVPKSKLTVVGDTSAPTEQEQGGFKVGDRVRLLTDEGGVRPAGSVGTVEATYGDCCRVEFDAPFDGWNGDNDNGRCWHVNNDQITLITEPTPDYQPKVGDRVRFTDECRECWWFGPQKKYKDGAVSKIDGGGELHIHVRCSNGDTAYVANEHIEPLPVAAEVQGADGKASVRDILDELEAWFGDAIPVAAAPATATLKKGSAVQLSAPALVTGIDPNNPAYAHIVLGTGGSYTLPVAALVPAA